MFKNGSLLKVFALLFVCSFSVSCSKKNPSETPDKDVIKENVELDVSGELQRQTQSGSSYFHEISLVNRADTFKGGDLSTLTVTEPEWIEYEYDRTNDRAYFRGIVPEHTEEELPTELLVRGTISDLDSNEHDWEYSLTVARDTVPVVYARSQSLAFDTDWNFEFEDEAVSDLISTEDGELEDFEIVVTNKPDWVNVSDFALSGRVPVLGFEAQTISGTITDSTGQTSDWEFRIYPKSVSFDVANREDVQIGHEFKYEVPATDEGDQITITNIPCWLEYDEVSQVFYGYPGVNDVGDNLVAGTIVNDQNVFSSWSFEIEVAPDVKPPVINSVYVNGGAFGSNRNPRIMVDLDGSNSGTVVSVYSDSKCETLLSGTELDDPVSYEVDIDVGYELEDGMHNFYALAKDASGNKSDCKRIKETYTLDTVAPVAYDILIDNSVVNKPKISVYFSGTDDNSVVNLYSDSSCETELASKPVDSEESHTVIELTDLTDGEHNLYALLTDRAKNQSECVSSSGTVEIIKEAPAVTKIALENPRTGTSYVSDPTLLIALSKATPGTTVELFSDNACNTSIASGTTNNSIIYLKPEQELADGTYAFSAKTKDYLGNVSGCAESSLNYTVDSTIEGADSYCEIVGLSDTDTPAVQSKTWNWSGCDEYRYAVSTSDAPGFDLDWSGWSDQNETTFDPVNELEQTYYLHVEGRNIDDSGTNAYSKAKAMIDSKKPEIVGINELSSPDRVKSKTWNWSCNEESGCIYRFEISISYLPTLEEQRFSNVNSVTKNCGSGVYYLHVQAKDAAGNISEVYTNRVIFENTNSNDSSSC